jgi:hypothetical protein
MLSLNICLVTPVVATAMYPNAALCIFTLAHGVIEYLSRLHRSLQQQRTPMRHLAFLHQLMVLLNICLVTPIVAKQREPITAFCVLSLTMI